jgi:Cft2 family RNA processing exonuclease
LSAKWDPPFLEQKAGVTKNGSILLGKYVVCDGFEWDREVAVFTHIHADHIKYFETCLGVYDVILCSPQTKELLMALKGKASLEIRRNFVALPCRQAYDYKDERITLYPSKHILGAVQVLVENGEGARIAYSGQFYFPTTKPIKSDVLVLDATYGDPSQTTRCSREEVIDWLVTLVRKELERASLCIMGYRGKLQEVMGILTKAGIRVPFLCEPIEYRICRVYQESGVDLGQVISLGDDAAKRVISSRECHILFHLLGLPLHGLPAVKYTKIRVSRWGTTTEPFCKTAKDYFVVTLSDHADFSGTMEFVRESRPSLVITDNSRGGSAETLAQMVKEQLHIEAKAMP